MSGRCNIRDVASKGMPNIELVKDGVGRLLGSYVTKKSRAFTVLPFLLL